MLKSIGYEPADATLEVEFRDGRVYVHRIVPESVYLDFLASESKGTYYRAHIQDHYPATQLE